MSEHKHTERDGSYCFAERLVMGASQVREALKHEPSIRPNFERADMASLVPIIFAVMWNGVCTAAAIYRYLEARGCRFDRDTVDFLLNAFEGDDPIRHLWSRGNLGDYQPHFTALVDLRPL